LRCTSVIVGFLAGLALGFGAPAAAQTVQEHEVKAAFLYRFLAFIEWSAATPTATASATAGAPGDALVIGIVGADDVASELERVVPGRNVNGRPVTVRRLKAGEAAASTAHVLMVGREHVERIPNLVRAGTVVVGEAEGALDHGAAINFVLDEGRVRFDVSLPAAERARVRIASRMLAVARQVKGRP
jgi:hypothetical protein